ncbi:UNVERIFIED_CONTAM: hypothetical protein GTU68_059594 [Idotea baltica]|nr:hypothetical protein [Idotea baltica]
MSDSAKRQIAEYIAEQVSDGALLGLGSGSTTELAIEAIGARIQNESLRVSGLPTSMRTASLAAKLGIQILHPAEFQTGAKKLDWGFDGADAVDPELNLIKGRGAAMLSEKVVAKRCKTWKILVTESKLYASLGGMSVPIEVIPEALDLVHEELGLLGGYDIQQRTAEKKYGPVITEHGNVIVDACFKEVSSSLEAQIKQIVGVVESGLFTGFNPEVIISDGSSKLKIQRIEANGLTTTEL